MLRTNLRILSLIILTALTAASCTSTAEKPNSVTFSTVTSGLVKHPSIGFSLYLINKIESREAIAARTSNDVYIVHTGHLLNSTFTKEQNEEVLKSLGDKGIDLINLTLEDFIIASNQGIEFENYPQKFLNSSVIDLNEDSYVTRPNITPFIIYHEVVFLGLSDKTLDPTLSADKFLVGDYALSVLRARKAAIGPHNPKSVVKPRSFVIVHTLGPEISELMERLPPNFINSLAN
jgi:hypothetical protein